MKRNLLEGSIRRQLIALALPLLVGNVLQQLYNAVDSLIVRSYLGTEAFSAVGIAGTVMNLMIFVLTGFCTGITMIFAQMYGKGDRAGFRREVFTAVSLGTGVTLLLGALFMLLLEPLLHLINAPLELIPHVQAYLSVIIGGMLCTFFYNLCSSMLNSIGDTRAATFFLLVSVVMNTVLDILFVGPLGFGIAGAAWATVLSQLFSALCCVGYILRRDRELVCTRNDMRLEKMLVRRTLVYGASSALHMSSLYIGKLIVQGAVDLLGTQGIAAYTATMRIEGFANSFGTSHGQAVSVLISQNHGAGKRDRVYGGLKGGLQLGLGMGAVLSVLMYVLAEPGVRFFLGDGEAAALAQGAAYLRQMALFYVLCFSGNAFVGFFRGAGQVYVPVIATTLHITIRAALSHLWIHSMGLRAVALATGLGWVTMTIFQVSTTLLLHKKKRV